MSSHLPQNFESFTGAPAVADVISGLAENRSVHVKGAVGAAKSLVSCLAHARFDSQVLFLSAQPEEAEEVKEEIEQLLDGTSVCHFPATAFFGAEFEHHNHESLRARLSTIESLIRGGRQIVVAHCSGLLPRLPNPGKYQSKKIVVAAGHEYGFEGLVEQLIDDLGFLRESRVEHPGEMCVRGGIIDLYPVSATEPFRLEFWGDQVESIRTFDPDTQRSSESIERVVLYPQELDSVADDASASGLSGLLAYLQKDAVVIMDEPDRIKKALLESAAAEIAPDEIELLWPTVEADLRLHLQLRLVSVGSQYENLVDLGCQQPEAFRGDIKTFREYLAGLTNGSDRVMPSVIYSCDSEAQAARLQQIFSDEEIDYPNLKILPIRLHNGFAFPEGDLVVFTDHQFYGRKKRLRLPARKFKGLTPRQLKHLNVGDYVVHVDYGIGVFQGLKKISVGGHERECLEIQYRGRDKVYVRVERMDRVNKYSSKGGATPQLNKLGSPEWQRLKSRTKNKIKNIARDLIQIYAKRKSQPGFAFSEDTLWQRELEASFPHEDTPDQITATESVKKDMESPRPMERLICGDVGFGKTEIAVRAAFKAVLAGKQVAILVPTTILAYQHLNTFIERLANFPVQVEMLSRFRTKAEQKKILERLQSGEVDILIGTHRLLSKDVLFKDLGLLVVDEEHRFGVTHKEKLKRLRESLDVLTLTATPIPRTLHFSLMGARDLTYINTAPRNRLPIITEVLPFNKHYIREVMLRELDRGGQVFFVHNRVKTIDRVGQMVSGMIPDASVAVAHGQMHEKELERVMVDFMSRKYQILVSTMIIESGLDMPNVNTIVVNRADKLGLAQLYQLRGRVGRSHQRAYAYFVVPPIETLTDDAMKRLRAIEEFSDIGSGGQLALRDLEIRGAGNLLGAEQTGFIDTLGFDLYNKILDEAVQEIKDESLPRSRRKLDVDTQVEMDFDAVLPQEYVDSGAERVDIYRRLTEATDVQEIDEIELELQDRFGRPPQAVRNLLDFLSIRILGGELGFRSITISQEVFVAEFSQEFLRRMGEHFKNWLGSILMQAPQPFKFIQNESLGMQIDVSEATAQDKLKTCKAFLLSLGQKAASQEVPLEG